MLINCPNCNKELELSSEHVGWRVQCPYCAEEFRAMETLARSENGLGADPDEVLSIDWDALETDEDERRKWEERATIWRERIQINCPECEAKVSLETRLLGGRVMCPHCGVAFLARGEGAMVTEDRNRYRAESNLEEKAQAIEASLDWGSEAMTTLQIGFKVGGRGCDVGAKGLHLQFWFEKNFDITGLLDHFTNLVESMIGYRLQIEKKKKDNMSDGFIWNVSYYVLQDCPHKMIAQSEYKRKQEANGRTMLREDVTVVRRQEEEDRLVYLIHGRCEHLEDIGC